MWNKLESPIEVFLYDALRALGLRPLCQYPVGFGYRIDLAVFYKGRHFAIECDGRAYHSGPQQKAHDRRKDAYLRRLGWIVFRVTGSVVVSDPQSAACEILNKIKKAAKMSG